MRHDPHTLIEGCLIASLQWVQLLLHLYSREYIREKEMLQRAIDEAYDAGLVGKNACNSGWDFDIFFTTEQELISVERKQLYLKV